PLDDLIVAAGRYAGSRRCDNEAVGEDVPRFALLGLDAMLFAVVAIVRVKAAFRRCTHDERALAEAGHRVGEVVLAFGVQIEDADAASPASPEGNTRIRKFVYQLGALGQLEQLPLLDARHFLRDIDDRPQRDRGDAVRGVAGLPVAEDRILRDAAGGGHDTLSAMRRFRNAGISNVTRSDGIDRASLG